MYIYFITATLSSLIAYFGSKTEKYKSGKRLPVIIASALPLFLLSAFRYDVGTDYRTYITLFNSFSNGHIIRNFDIGFIYLCRVIGILGGNFYTMIFVTSLIFISFVFYYIYYDSPYPYISIYLVFAMQYYFASFNGIRQMCGAAILLFSLKFVREKKLIPFLICVFSAYAFHNTCIVFLPVYWFDKFKIKPIYIIIISIFVFVFGDRIANIINTFMINTKYESYAREGGDGRIRLSWTLIQVAIVIFSSLYYKNESKYNMLYNLQVVTMWLSFLNSDVSWIWRIQWTTGLAGIVFIPYVISKSNIRNNKILYALIVIACFSIYIYISTVRGGKHDVLPYMTYLTSSLF